MADIPKINVSPALALPLALGCKGYHALDQALGKFPVKEHVSKIRDHSLVQQASEKKEMLLAILGLALVLHGAHFKNLLLCTQVVFAFLFERVKGSVMVLWGDITTAREKLQADAPAEEPAKDGGDDKSKHAKKRDAKKTEDGRKGSPSERAKEDAEATKKVLKILDPEKLSAAGVEVFAALMACILVIHGGLAQKIAIAHSLVGLLADRVEALLHFPDHEDIEAWTRLLSRLVIWIVVLNLTLFFAPLALAMNASACGARLVADHGFQFAKISADSKQGILAKDALAVFGTLWQLWSWAAESSLPFYFSLAYLPAVVAEGLLGFF